MASTFSYKQLLTVLSENGVRCIVIGGAAALHGSSMLTKDLDIVPDRSADNLDRFEKVLGALDTLVRDPAGRPKDLQRRRDFEGAAGRRRRLALGP